MLDPADLDAIRRVFRYYEIKETANADILLGDPLVGVDALYGSLYPHFSRRNKAVSLEWHLGETALVIRSAKADNIWIHVALALATFATTTIAGALLYGADIFKDPLRVYEGLPFALAIMAVLGAHELGHYIVSKKNGIDTTLPYFIPFPPFFTLPIGTMGAVIRQKGPVPNRKALFDVSIAGPLTGLAVAVIVTAVGLTLPAPAVNTDGATYFQLGTPVLFDLLAGLVHPGSSLRSISPIAFAGWVGMLVTVLNMIPVGQLDGGHVARAVLGKGADRLSRALPMAILAFGAYTTFIMGAQGEIWIFWGLLTSFMGSGEHPKPTEDEKGIGLPRIALCAIGFGLTLLCFTPFPISA